MFLPFDMFSAGTMWKGLVGTLNAYTTPFPELPPPRVKHLLIELYVATKQVREYAAIVKSPRTLCAKVANCNAVLLVAHEKRL